MPERGWRRPEAGTGPGRSLAGYRRKPGKLAIRRVRAGSEGAAGEVQLRLLREGRGRTPSSSAGKVTLLDPDDHAAALAIMRAHGREPMSMSHGDVDYGYLERLVLGPGGRPRLRRVSFAARFDSLMFGRRGIPGRATRRR